MPAFRIRTSKKSAPSSSTSCSVTRRTPKIGSDGRLHRRCGEVREPQGGKRRQRDALLQGIEGGAGEGHAVAACVLAAPRASPQRRRNMPSEPISGVRRVTLQLVEDDGALFFEVLIRKAGILEQTRHQVDRAVYILRRDHQEVGHYFTGGETVGRRVEPAGCSPKRVRVALVRAEQDVLVQVREPPLGRLLG